MSEALVVDVVADEFTAPAQCCDAAHHEHHPDDIAGTDQRTTSVPLFARAPHLVIRAYQWLFAGRVSPCRFEPSCSTYALESFEVHGLIRGSLLSLRRLSRCHPWGGHGWDPVPRKKAA